MTKTGNCKCGKRSVLLHQVGDAHLCMECATSSQSELSEDARKQLQEDTGGKEVLMD